MLPTEALANKRTRCNNQNTKKFRNAAISLFYIKLKYNKIILKMPQQLLSRLPFLCLCGSNKQTQDGRVVNAKLNI